MGYLQFEKSQLINLEYSLDREIIRTNRAGSYASSTIIGCNTRKYHGLLICPCHDKSNEKYLLLSSLDPTIVQHDQEFNLGIHKYQGDLYVPKGHKYIRDYQAETLETVSYRVGGVQFKKETLLSERQEQVLIRYTLDDAHSQTLIRLRPFLAFRKIHELSKANLYANTKFKKAKNGIVSKLYDGFPSLYMQFSKSVDFIPVPDWYYNIEYKEEQKRGYEYKEDLYVPGYFEFGMKKGESIVFSGSIHEAEPLTLKKKFNAEVNKRTPRDSYKNCLITSAQQFLVRKEKDTEIISGYHWYGTYGRDTFISLPGITLATGNVKFAREVFDSMVRKMSDGLFPNKTKDDNLAYNSVDAPLWFIWSLQQYEKYDPQATIWKNYGKAIKSVLNAFRAGTRFNIHMEENGLIYAGEEGSVLTWMDAVTTEGAVTPRIGFPVEINALWYNAVCKSLEWASSAGDKKHLKEWEDLPDQIREAFVNVFWYAEKGYLYDYVKGDTKDFSVRPNQIIAASVDYSPITKEMKNSLLEVVKRELLTPKGIRSLSPKNILYVGICEGDHFQRAQAYHQGSVWPWLLEHFVKAYMDVHKNSGISLAKQIYSGFEEEMVTHGIGSISEIYDGDPPHYPKGAISQAWSVAALLRINEMIEVYERKRELELTNTNL